MNGLRSTLESDSECLAYLIITYYLTFISQVNDNIVDIPNFSPTTKGVLWENWSPDKVRLF